MEIKPSTIIYGALTVILTLIALITLSMVFPGEMVRVNHIRPDIAELNSPPMPVSHSFSFRNDTITITAVINKSVYRGAKNTDKRIFTFAGVPYATWEGESIRKMAQDPALDDLFNDLISQFRKIRAERNLTDDEYAELLTAYSQSFTYHTSDLPAKYPVETLYEEEGDCDDMSLLLAGLLSREGYKTSFFLFEKDHHVVVGVGSDDNRYLNTEYAYVDIMDYSFIGVPVNELRGSDTMYLDPIVIPIGSGTKIYHSGGETRNIADMATLTYRQSGNLSVQMKNMRQDTAENITEYNRITGDFNTNSRIYTYIIRHRFDRPGVYAYLQREMPA
ncbi:MAG: hypothetical protein WC379_12340 [Methanoregula sp.]|jgi:hypothetical protein